MTSPISVPILAAALALALGASGCSSGSNSCDHDTGPALAGYDGSTDGACVTTDPGDCFMCCQASFPKGAATYAAGERSCSCQACGDVCPGTCGCGGLEDDTCSNCIEMAQEADAGCIPDLATSCQADPDCSAFAACVTGVCQLSL